jgi:hypothetical protein
MDDQLNDDIVQLGTLDESLVTELYIQLGAYSIGLATLSQTYGVEDALLRGSGTLIQRGNRRAILTADHVVDESNFPRTGELLLITATNLERTRIDVSKISLDRIARGCDDGQGPDLALIHLSEPIASALAAKKSFVNLDKVRQLRKEKPLLIDDGFWGAQGFVAEYTKDLYVDDGRGRIKQFYNLFGASGSHAVREENSYDYIELTVSFDDLNRVPTSFQGMSGGGLWQIPLARDEKGKIVYRTPRFSGVVFYQRAATNEVPRSIICHGPKTIDEIVWRRLEA